MIHDYPELPVALPVIIMLVIVEPIGLAKTASDADKINHLLKGIGLDAGEIVQGLSRDDTNNYPV